MEENKVEKKRINKNLLKYVAIILILLLILINIPGPQKSANEKKPLAIEMMRGFEDVSVVLFDDGTIYQGRR